MKRYLIFMALVFGLTSGCHAASPSFSSFYTNHFLTNGLVIKAKLNPTQFDTNASSITITITNIGDVPGSGVFTNVAGVIKPKPNQITNALLFISGSADAATNTALTVDTVNTWTDENTKLLSLRHQGTNVAYITPYGSFESGKGVASASPSRDDILLGIRDTSLGESDYALIYTAAIDGSSPTNYSVFRAQLNTGDGAGSILSIGSVTNGVSSRFTVQLQPSSGVANITLLNQDNTTFSVLNNSGYTGTGTNFLRDDGTYGYALTQSDQLWTNDLSISGGGSYGYLRPVETIDYRHIAVSNFFGKGWFLISPQFQFLQNQTNTLDSTTFSSFYLLSGESDPTQRIVQLSAGGYDGHELTLLSMTNTPWNGRFTLPANSVVVPDEGGIVKLNNDQDWIGANGSVLKLQWLSPNWWEVGRWFAGTTNQPQPVVMNPTDNYLPRRQSQGVFNDSPLATPGGSTNLVASGALILGGTNSVDYFGGSFSGLTLGSFNDNTKGGDSTYQITVGGGDPNGDQGYALISGNSISSFSSANTVVGSDVYTAFLSAQTPPQAGGVYAGWNSTNLLALAPFMEDNPIRWVYKFDSAYPLAQTGLATFQNNTTNMLSVGPSGQVIFGPGTTNVLYRVGSDLVYTNGYAQPAFYILNGSGTGAKVSGTSGGGRAMLEASGLSGAGLGVVGNNDGVIFQGAVFAPLRDNTTDVSGPSSSAWFKNAGWRGTNYVAGYVNAGTNYSWLAITHTGTNGTVILDSQSANAAGDPRSINFQIGSTNIVRIDRAASAGETRFWLYDEDNGTMERVTVGAADSGGVGFKLLRIPN